MLPLLTIALGGNALSPPAGDQSYGAEREIVIKTAQVLAVLAARGYRLLIVHGNGPQVGRLMRDQPEAADLDVYVAQTQGELGYLLAEALEQATSAACAALITRVTVDADDPAFLTPTKPVGPILTRCPADGAAALCGTGYRRLVASPRPREILDLRAIEVLLDGHHVIAGGGGGIPLVREGRYTTGMPGVIDKDWVAAKLAVSCAADALIFATDVEGVIDEHGQHNARCVSRLDVAAARGWLARGDLGVGSMAPKLESAVEFVVATGRRASILHTDQLAAALDDPAPGTLVTRGL